MNTGLENAGASVAVVGAGLSGLVCARALARAGHSVRVFEKARGPGGRMSTRRARDLRFDHGAQYFTARAPAFSRAVESWRREGLVATWEGRIDALEPGGRRPRPGPTERLVAVPGMNAVARHLAADLDVTLETRVAALKRAGDRWRLESADGADLGEFDAAVVSAPAPQTARLLADVAPGVSARAGRALMAPCWAAMVSFAAPLDVGFDGAFIDGSPLSWVARNGSKPGRPDGEAWVLHASPEWSRRHLELDRGTAADRLLEAFRDAVGEPLAEPGHIDAHRWRFSLPTEPLTERSLFDPGLALGACGDWCGGPRIEGAFLSGSSIAERLLAHLGPPLPAAIS